MLHFITISNPFIMTIIIILHFSEQKQQQLYLSTRETMIQKCKPEDEEDIWREIEMRKKKIGNFFNYQAMQ